MKRVKMLPLLVSLVICSALFFTMCDEIDDLFRNTSPIGVYVGIFSFAQGENSYDYGIKDLVPQGTDVQVNMGDPSLAWLTQSNLSGIQNTVLPKYQQGNTNGRPLVFAVDWAINNLTRNKDRLANRLDNLTIISFSNGTDQISGSLFELNDPKHPYDTLPEYGGHVKDKIDNTTIRGVPINAWAIGLKGTGPDADEDRQKQTLRYVSSGSGDKDEDYNFIFKETLDKSALDAIFNSISDSLTSIKYAASLTIRVNGPASFVLGNDIGEGANLLNFCATFDGAAPDASNNSVKGRIQRNSSNRWEIDNLEFKGITAPASLTKADQCGKQGTYVDFGFTGLEELGKVTLQEYMYTTTDGGKWTLMTGASSDTKVTQLRSEQKSAIVLLVLDATLSTDNITMVRSAASDFLSRLYNASKP